jgi:hypothetical protein
VRYRPKRARPRPASPSVPPTPAEPAAPAVGVPAQEPEGESPRAS